VQIQGIMMIVALNQPVKTIKETLQINKGKQSK
jgi:hypothetical protein